MSVTLPSPTLPIFAANPRTTLKGATGRELTAFWAITGVVALGASTGIYEIVAHFLG